MKPKHQRLVLALLALAAVGGASGLALSALKDQAAFFYAPGDVVGKPLPFNTEPAKRGTPAGVLGYPGGGGFRADRAAILDVFTAIGRNIYNQGRTARDVYSIQANVVPGNSGGPLVNAQGDVIGVIFATSTTYNNVGYALSLQRVTDEVASARTTNQPVGTGSCAE